MFSHIHQTYVVETFQGIVDDGCQGDEDDGVASPRRWVTKQQFLESAVSTAMKKVFKAYDEPSKKVSCVHGYYYIDSYESWSPESEI